MSPQRVARTCMAAVVVLVAVAGTACTGPSGPAGPAGDPGASPATAGPTARGVPGLDRPDSTAAAEVQAAYLRFWAVAQQVDRQPVTRWRAVLETVAGQPLLGQLLDGLLQQRDRGIAQYGTVVPRPTVAYLAGDGPRWSTARTPAGPGRSTGSTARCGASAPPALRSPRPCSVTATAGGGSRRRAT